MTFPLIGIEGRDASGKATLTASLTKRLSEHYGHAESFSFPAYGTKVGALLLSHLKGEWSVPDTDADPAANMRVRQTLMTVNRLEVQARIAAALLRGAVVLDRWVLSSLAYGVVEGLNPDWILSISATLLRPDLWLLLDVDSATPAARRPPRDLNESDVGKMERVRVAYLEIFSSHGLTSPIGLTPRAILDASQPADRVFDAAWGIVSAHCLG